MNEFYSIVNNTSRFLSSFATRRSSRYFKLSVEQRDKIEFLGLVMGEMRSLWSDGLLEYVSDLWNIVDFIQNMFYVIWVTLRLTAWIVVQVLFLVTAIYIFHFLINPLHFHIAKVVARSYCFPPLRCLTEKGKDDRRSLAALIYNNFCSRYNDCLKRFD